MNSSRPASPTKPNRTLPAAILLVLGGLLAWWVLSPKPMPAPVAPSANLSQSDQAASPPLAVDSAAPANPPSVPPGTVSAPVAMLPQQVAALAAVLTPSGADDAGQDTARVLIDAADGPLYQQLNLSAAETANMDGLLARRLNAIKGTIRDVASQGLSLANDQAQITQMVRDAAIPVEAEIRSTLGDAAYAQYRAYATPLRSAVLDAVLQSRAAAPVRP